MTTDAPSRKAEYAENVKMLKGFRSEAAKWGTVDGSLLPALDAAIAALTREAEAPRGEEHSHCPHCGVQPITHPAPIYHVPIGKYRVTVAENAITISEGRKLVFAYDADEPNTAPAAVTVNALIESARCLGVAQQKGDECARTHWESEVAKYRAALEAANG